MLLFVGCAQTVKVAPPSLTFSEFDDSKRPNLSSPGDGETLVAVRVSNTSFMGGGKTKNTYTLFQSPDLGQSWPQKKRYTVFNTDNLGIRRLNDLLETTGGWHAVTMSKGLRPGLLSFGKSGKGHHRYIDDSWDNGHGIFAAGRGQTLVYGQPQKGKLRLLVSRDEGDEWEKLELTPELEEGWRLLTGRTKGQACQAAIDEEGTVHILAIVQKGRARKCLHARLVEGKLATPIFLEETSPIGVRLFGGEAGLFSFILTEGTAAPAVVKLRKYSTATEQWDKAATIPLASSPDGWDLSPAQSFSIDVAKNTMAIAYVGQLEKKILLQVTYSRDGGLSWTEPESLGAYNKWHTSIATPSGLMVKGSNSNATRSYKDPGPRVVLRGE